MLILRGPAPVAEDTIYLPNPDLGDAMRPESRVALKRMMDGGVATYVVRRPSQFTRTFTIDVPYLKALEFWSFVNTHLHNRILVYEDSGLNYTGVLLINPLTLQPEKRSVVAGSTENVKLNFDIEKV